MTIKWFLISISTGLFLIGGYFNIKYIKEISIEEQNPPIENYFIIDKYCSSSYKGSSFVKIHFNGQKYDVDVPVSDCPNITDEYFQSKLYYINDSNKLIYKDYSVSRGILCLRYTFALLIPLVGFRIYRKELDNHYSTM